LPRSEITALIELHLSYEPHVNPWQERLWPRSWEATRIIFDDDALLAIDKPAGVDCAVLRKRVAASRGGRLWLPRTIDRSMSGVLIFAKTRAASRNLAGQFEGGVAQTHEAIVEQGGTRRHVSRASSKPSQPVRRDLADELVGVAVPAHRVMLHLGEVLLAHPSSSEPLVLRAPMPPAMLCSLAGNAALPTTRDAIEERLRVAADLRYDIAVDDTDAFRVANSGGDDLPGVELDRYGDFAVVSLRTEEALAIQETILDAVHSLGFAGVYLKVRQKHASVLVDTRGDAIAPSEPVRGRAAPTPLSIQENGLSLLASLGDGLSTGVFLDQRDGRRWLRERGAKTVLNLFAYHGAFTVAAIAGGAHETVTVDASGAALEGARANLAHVEADASQHVLVKADAFRWLEGAVKRQRQFEVVVLDPPSFSTTKRSTFRADRHYCKLAALALRCVAPGGALLACTNHRGIVPHKFARELERAADEVGARTKRMTSLTDPIDFPPEPGQPNHLKRFVVELAT
jgi:23S rRNA (cytosine1962-C5)-methyltransferase